MLALRGVPGIYFHSLFGSQNWLAGVAQTGRNRTINREKLQLDILTNSLHEGIRQLVFEGYCAMLEVRSAEIAFHPNGNQTILDLHPSVIAIKRTHQGESILCLHNTSTQLVDLSLDLDNSQDLLTGNFIHPSSFQLHPYASLWLKLIN